MLRRDMNKKRGLIIASSSMLVVGALVGSSVGAQAAGGVDMKVGIVLPLTGQLATYGPPMAKAAALGVTSVNDAMKAAGVAGSCTVAGTEDDQATPATSVEAAKKLVDSNGANALVGPMTSGTTLAAAAAIGIPNSVLIMSPAASSPALTTLGDGDTLFRNYPSDALQAKAVVLAMSKAFGKTALVNVAARNDAFGSALSGVFQAAWKKNGGKIGTSVLYNPNAATFDSDATKIVSGKPAAWFIVDFEETFAKVAPALVRTKKWDQKRTFMTESFNNAGSIKIVGAQYMNGVRGTAAAASGTATAAWKTAFEATVPAASQTFVDPAAYDAAVLECLASIYAKSTKAADLAKGLRAVGGPAGAKISWQHLDAAVKAAAAGTKFSYQGAWSETDFDENGDVGAGTFDVYKVIDGKPVTDPKAQVHYKG
jgi:branched-chain amino acid transport system substrate-binding protein